MNFECAFNSQTTNELDSYKLQIHNTYAKYYKLKEKSITTKLYILQQAPSAENS
jgi:hypothetical protein